MTKHLLSAFALFSLVSFAAPQDDQYVLGPDSQVKPGVPQGKVTQHVWNSSKVYPGTTRDWWVYVPAQYDAAKPANLMVFCDGGGFVKPDGQFRAPIVFDNLIAAGEMPVTIGIFINPGVFGEAKEGQKPRSNRSFEYDSLGDLYARFLLEEILPEVEKTYKFTDDPEGRAICGNSSGGICAFTVAWERPDAFRKVVSHIGSFTNIRGGHVYPALVRKTEKKPLRVFLQDGTGDIEAVELFPEAILLVDDAGAAGLLIAGGGEGELAVGVLLGFELGGGEDDFEEWFVGCGAGFAEFGEGIEGFGIGVACHAVLFVAGTPGGGG